MRLQRESFQPIMPGLFFFFFWASARPADYVRAEKLMRWPEQGVLTVRHKLAYNWSASQSTTELTYTVVDTVDRRKSGRQDSLLSISVYVFCAFCRVEVINLQMLAMGWEVFSLEMVVVCECRPNWGFSARIRGQVVAEERSRLRLTISGM